MKLNRNGSALCSLGFSGVWDSQNFPNIKWLTTAIKNKMQDQYIQKWLSLTNNSSGCNNYRLFKTEFKKSEYFNVLSKRMSRQFLSFRTRNHRFPVEKGRWLGTHSVRENVCYAPRISEMNSITY